MAPPKLRQLAAILREAPRSQLGWVAVLMLGSALSEGTGIAMLVPMLEFAGVGTAIGSAATASLLPAAFPQSLELLLLAFLALITLRIAIVYRLGQLRGNLQLGFADGLRRRCYDALLHADWRWLAAQRSADHNAALVTNSSQAGIALDQALGLIFNALTAMAVLAVSLALSWRVTLLALGMGLIAALVIAPLLRRAGRLGRETNEANRELHRHVEHGIAQFRETKIAGAEPAVLGRFNQVIDQIRTRKQVYRDDSALGIALIQLAGAVLLAVTVYLGRSWAGLTMATLLPLLLVFLRLVPLLQSAQQGWSMVLYTMPALSEVQRITAAAAAHAEPPLPESERMRLGTAITLEAASVVHPDRSSPALQQVSLTIPARSTTAIIGPSGAGKSTLADLIGGLITPDSGRVLIDGAALTGPAQRGWRGAVAYLQQTPVMPHGSVRDYLGWPGQAPAEDVLTAALQLAQADFVLALPAGLDTAVGDSGVRLSGGERQRIALARCLLRQPELLILDEVTSALDAENEAAVLAAVAAMHGRLTIVMIGHRPAMLAIADQVLELRDGRLVEAG